MRPYLFALGAVLCWASLPAATGSALKEFSSEEALFYSFTVAAVVLYLQNGLTAKRWKIIIPERKALMLGIWGIFLYHYVYYKAMDNAPLAEATILATTWSFWIVVFSSIMREKRVRPGVVVVGIVGMIGAALVISSGRELSFDASYLFGYALALGCGFIWSSFSVLLPRVQCEEDPMPLFTILAALFSAVPYMLTGPHAMPSTGAMLSVVYLGAVPLALSFYLWQKAVNTGDLSRIGFLSYLTTPLAVLLVSVIYAKPVSAQVLTGMLLILGAAVIGNMILSRKK